MCNKKYNLLDCRQCKHRRRRIDSLPCDVCQAWSKWEADEEYVNSREEISYIIKYALDRLERDGGTDSFCLPNGSTWKYDSIRKFIKDNLIW